MKKYCCRLPGFTFRIGLNLPTFEFLIGISIVIFACYARGRGVLLSDLWEDEIWRANQILHSSTYWELLQGKYKGGEAPVQLSEWLLGKTGLMIWGNTDFSFRVWSCLFSSISVFVFWLLLRELVSKSWALVGLTFFALNPGMIEHSQEFKPYSLDALLSILCLYFFLIEARSGWRNWKQYVAFLSCFALFSNCFLFFLFVIPIVYWCVRSEIKESRALLIALLSIPIILYLALYTLHSLAMREHDIFIFWKPQMLTSWTQIIKLFSKDLPNALEWYAFYPINFRYYPAYYSWAALVLLVIITPMFALKDKNWAGAFIFFPFLLQSALSMFGMFPMFQRVATFYYPFFIVSFCILCDIATCFILHSLPALQIESQKISMLSVLPILILQIYYGSPSPSCCMRHVTKVEPLLRKLEAQAHTGDVVYLSPKALMSVDYYKFAPKRKVVLKNELLSLVRFQDVDSAAKTHDFLQAKFIALGDKGIWLLCMEAEIESSIKIYKEHFMSIGYHFKIVGSGNREFLAHAWR